MVRILWIVTLLLAAIGVAAVTRRAVDLFEPSPAPARFSEAGGMDTGFARHRALTLFHIVPGFLFMVLGPLQFVRSIRVRRPGVHRWIGRVFLISGLIVGVTALVLGPQVAIGGANETAATLLFGSLFLFALVKAWLSIRRRKVAQHREWMIRAFAIGLAVATIRPIVGMFFATARLTHLTPHEFFGTAFWLGFTIQSIAAEIWIDYTRRAVREAKA